MKQKHINTKFIESARDLFTEMATDSTNRCTELEDTNFIYHWYEGRAAAYELAAKHLSNVIRDLSDD